MGTQQGRATAVRGRRPRTSIAVAGALAAMLLVSGCAGDKQGSGGGMSMPPMPVETAAARTEKVTDRFEAVGTVEAMEAVTIVSEIDGTVTDLPFTEGTFIRKGTLIARLEDSQLAAEVARAEALHAQSHAMYERVKAVVEQRAGTPQDLDDAEAGLKVADANLSLAKARFAKTRIVAPFNGIIGARKVSVGAFLRTGQPIAELANIDDIRVNFSAPERILAELSRGAKVTVSTTAFPGHTTRGEVIVIEPVLDPGTRNARLVARVANPGRRFRQGMSANIVAVLSERNNATTVPSEAIFASGSQSFVFVVNGDSTAARVPVKTGTRMAGAVEIVEGVGPGTLVVQAGHQKLFDGARVMPVQAVQQESTTQAGVVDRPAGGRQ